MVIVGVHTAIIPYTKAATSIPRIDLTLYLMPIYLALSCHHVRFFNLNYWRYIWFLNGLSS